MDIINKIEAFKADIYFKLPNELNKDFINISSTIDDYFNTNFSNNQEIINKKNKLLEYLFEVMKTKDFIKMADALYYNVKPILEDVN